MLNNKYTCICTENPATLNNQCLRHNNAGMFAYRLFKSIRRNIKIHQGMH